MLTRLREEARVRCLLDREGDGFWSSGATAALFAERRTGRRAADLDGIGSVGSTGGIGSTDGIGGPAGCLSGRAPVW
ncbi:hypothetical protein [Streptomyces sp. NPDC056796]|uniref:hypothetical protein n=1 Tax=Streptomyces sp. NPDC056796 TaxID=3345947 RepID=UPI0036B02872